jgi:cytochrome bd-type quinol oxidase subunit 2
MSIQLFISGLILSFLLGMVCSRLLQGQQRHGERQHDIDRLVEQFQELFRQIDRDKKQHPQA